MDTQVEAKIKAIKTLREIAPRHGFTGNGDYLGLKDAKDIIDIIAPIFRSLRRADCGCTGGAGGSRARRRVCA